jgi:isopenicillin-N N-acyltransferase-like protein
MTIPLVHAHGDGRGMGRTYGEAFADGIQESLVFYNGLLGGAKVSANLGRYIDAARAAAPLLAEEVEGIAEGAGISSEDAWWLNCLEEVSNTEACTTMVFGPWLMHAEQWYAGHSAIGIVIAHPDAGPDFIYPTCVGFLPAVGLSSAGFAQGIDSLYASDDRIGIPRVVVSRRALGSRSVEDAVAAACMPGRAGGYAHTLASTSGTVVVETTASTQTVMRNTAAHTNHYLSDPPAGTPPPSQGSESRLHRAFELLEQAPPHNLEDCAALLSDHNGTPQSICLHGDVPAASATVFGMVCDIGTGQVIVSDGPPCRGRWEEFSLPLSEASLVE